MRLHQIAPLQIKRFTLAFQMPSMSYRFIVALTDPAASASLMHNQRSKPHVA